MKKNKINIIFDGFTIKKPFISSIITKCIDAVLTSEGIKIPCEINVLITGDKGIRAINAASRNLDSATDVLSFPMFELTAGAPPTDWSDYLDAETGLCPLGDMAISLERAVAQSKEFGHTLTREVGYLTIHSVLHLLGYDHLDEGAEKSKMRGREEAIAKMIPGVQR